MLRSISPIDGRYAPQTAALTQYFSEYALIRYRLMVEIIYFKALTESEITALHAYQTKTQVLDDVFSHFSIKDAERIKEIEKTTNHDVKALEYFIKEKISDSPLAPVSEFIHFGLTSQDINNTAIPALLRDASNEVVFPLIVKLISRLKEKAEEWIKQPMLAHTHGQAASPTTLGKELKVFEKRIQGQFDLLTVIPFTAKFGGATGNFNAHAIAYPAIDWHAFGDRLIASLGLNRTEYTTQIEPYDFLASYCHALARINTICIDLCRDIWMYISMNYLSQKVVVGEIGSSAMPHKVNPIDFENAEGNLGLANALLYHFAEKLPISRLQRDLTDSTVLRNLGVPIGHTIIAITSILKGLDKIEVNKEKINRDLDNNWAVISEAIQTILRREGIANPYELLKDLTRGNKEIDQSTMHTFIENLPVTQALKAELKSIKPSNYFGQIKS